MPTLPFSVWDSYAQDFAPSPAYVEQERTILAVLSAKTAKSATKAGKSAAKGPKPAAKAAKAPSVVLEAGPGFGRIAKLLLGSLDPTPAAYYAIDVTPTGLKQAEAYIGQPFTVAYVAPIQSPDLEAELAFLDSPIVTRPPGLVVAVEVLMHIPPTEAQKAIDNLVALAHGAPVLTCDWTDVDPSQGPDLEARAAANGNWRHDYPRLFAAAGATILASVPTAGGLQTVYLVQS